MDLLAPIALVLVGAVALLLLALVLGRRRRGVAMTPVRLGPTWRPPGAEQEPQAPSAPPDADERATILAADTGVEPRVVACVLNAWDEHLAVLGLLDLPAAHRYRVYDPYDPPVAERRDGRPVPDPVRVARDVARREAVAEIEASAVLDALLADDDGPRSEPG